jgi:hypothetical protein
MAGIPERAGIRERTARGPPAALTYEQNIPDSLYIFKPIEFFALKLNPWR